MTDIASPAFAGARRSDARAALIAKRNRAELRFRFYGIAAIVVTGIFLVLVMADIIVKGIPAFTEHRLDFEIVADQAALDPEKTGDPKTLLAGDYDKLIRDALRAEFPSVESRADRKLLTGLLSSGAADDFRRMVSRDPSLVGTRAGGPGAAVGRRRPVPQGLSDGNDRAPGNGELTVTLEGTTYNVRSSGDDFAKAYADVRDFLTGRLDADDKEMKRLSSALVRARCRGNGGADRQDKHASRPGSTTLKAKLADASGAIELDTNLPSLLVSVNGGTDQGQQSQSWRHRG